METHRNGVDSWPTSPDSDEHDQSPHGLNHGTPHAVPFSDERDRNPQGLNHGTPHAIPFSSSNNHTPQTTVPSSSEANQSKPSLPSPPGRRQRMAQIGMPWTSSIYDCGQDQTSAIMTALFPCVTFGQIAEIVDEGQTSCTLGSFMFILLTPALCSCWILASSYRKKMRRKLNLVQAPAEDWVLHLFCPLCALCQEFRELKTRGIDPALGWMGYLAKQHEETLTIPPKSQAMRF